MRLSALYAQTTKELDQFWRDRLTVGLALLLPVAAMLMYGLAARLEAKDIRVAVTNFDSGKLSRELVDHIFATVQLIPAAAVTGNITAPLDASKAKAAVVIPPEFSRNLKAGRTATYQAIIDGSDVNNARVIKNALVAATGAFEQVSGMQLVNQPIRAAVRLWYNPGRKESLYVVPGSIAMVLWIFPALLAVLALARENEQGTILQVYASNLTALEFMGGKAIAYIFVGLLEFLCLITVAMMVFGLQFRAEPVTFAIVTILYVASGVLFGLLAGTRANTQMAGVQIVANVGFLATMLFSGFLYPLRNIVFPLSMLAYLVPAMYYIRVARNEFVRGADWSSLWYAIVYFVLIDALFLLIISRMQMKLRG